MSKHPVINGELLSRYIADIAQIGATPSGGVNRIAYSPADLHARECIEILMRDMGMSVRRDPAGNTIARLEGRVDSLPAIAIGSHTDSVPEGGHYDGVLGVATGLAIVHALRSADYRLYHPLELINFAAEEGALAGGTFGSRAMAGISVQTSLKDASFNGTSVADHILACGMDPERISDARRHPSSLAAFYELHIEQGPELEKTQIPIGIVTAIAGIRRYSVTVKGKADHAGTAPMESREDALVSAAQFILIVNRAATEVGIRATVGTLRIQQPAANVVPGQVEMSLESRAQNETGLQAFEEAIEAWINAHTKVEIKMINTGAKKAIPASSLLLSNLEKTCRAFNLPFYTLPSWAGHDAGQMANLCDMAMIFVPSKGGVSHNPEEYTSAVHCTQGADVLLKSIIDIDTVLHEKEIQIMHADSLLNSGGCS